MKRKEVFNAMLASAALSTATAACAQSSVTLYGIVDSGVVYANNQGSLGSTNAGRSVVKLGQGISAGNRFGFTGAEDLGGGLKAIFKLESNFNLANGNQQYDGALFGFQSYAGLSSSRYGTLTAGRQYMSYYALLSPYSPTQRLTGFFGAHPGDLDGLDSTFRANNSLVYTSPALHGLTVSASYALAGVPGSLNAGSTWSGALQYVNGPMGVAAGFSRVNNATPGGGAFSADSSTYSGRQAGLSAVTSGYRTAQAQQRVAMTGGFTFNSAWDVSASYSNVQYIAGINSAFASTAIFNTAGAVLHWKPSTTVDLSAGYSYTRATQSNEIKDAARYQQFTTTEYYWLSKSTGLYAMQGFQHASGDTLGPTGAGHVVAAVASIGDGFQSAPSSSGNQFAAAIGMIHKF